MNPQPAEAVSFALKSVARQLHGSLPEDVVEAVLSDAVELARSDDLPDDAYNKGKGYLFQLARRLMRHFPKEDRKELGQTLAPVAMVFVEALRGRRELPTKDVDWSDAEDVQIAFEAEWSRVRYAEGEDLLREAFVRAERRPRTKVGGKLGLMISTACYLQEANGGKSFLLPLTDEAAALFGVSKTQLGSYINVATDRGFFKILKQHVPHVKAREFRLDTDHPDLVP